MIRKLLRRVLEPRHFWRDSGFTELNELYLSSLLRRLSISVLMIFVPIYLYREGYIVASIFTIYAIFFLSKAICDVLAGFTVARFGPKHTMIVAALLQVASTALFMTVPQHHWSIFILGSIWGASASFYFIPYHVEFSKIKHSKHAGSEIGYMNVVERAGAALGPAIGGGLAVFFGAPAIFLVGTILAFMSLWPLFRSSEPVRTKQQLNFADFPLARARRDIVSYIGLNVENTICINAWPFYVSLFILTGSVYAQLGIMSSVAIIASIYSAHWVGKLLDKKGGLELMRLSLLVNATIHAFRPFVSTLLPSYAVSVANEVVTNGYRIPYTKGMYAAADEYPGFRIVYVVTMECIGSICKGLVWSLLALSAIAYGSQQTFKIGFMVATVASLVIMLERFAALRPKGVA